MKHGAPPFDAQAARFDRRVGLSEEMCREIAGAVEALGQVRPGDLVVDVGAGTGEIGTWIGRPPARYLGFDLSGGMLEVFRKRLDSDRATRRGGARLLLRADGDREWPIQGGAARVVFSSRAIHLMEADHVVRQFARLAHPEGAALLVGRVRRSKDSVKTRMRDEMRRRLRSHGLAGREVDRNRRRILEACLRRPAEAIEPLVVSRWTVSASPQQSIESWQQKRGLAGVDPPPATKREILEELRSWAQEIFGGLDVEIASEEAYVLEGVRLPAA